MAKKPTDHELPLRLLIRKIVKEELKKIKIKDGSLHMETETPKTVSSDPQKQKSPLSEPFIPSTHSDPYHSQSWAIFGTPEPDPERKPVKKEHPRALPGWPELYRPDFTGFDSAPYLPKQPKSRA